ALWMHGPATMWVCAALYLIGRPDRTNGTWIAAAGFALGMAALTRPTTALFALATWLAFLGQRRWKDTLALSIGGAFPAVALVLLNWTTFGDPLRGGYVDDNWTESPPLWIGLSGLLVAPSRGLLVYS